jgi:hypothetical protein
MTTAPTRPQRTGGTVEDATRTADFDRLTLLGAAARGRVVRAQLYCEPAGDVALTQSDTIDSDIAPMVDPQSKRVPAARCKWGAQDDPRRSELLLLVPQQLAGDFAAQPAVLDGTVRRSRVIANVEWMGQSRALALETVAIYRGAK